MGRQIRNGLRAGVIFAIVIIFLVLIGFNVTASDLIDKVMPDVDLRGFSPVMVNMLVFFGLLGLWAGAQGSRAGATHPDSWAGALVGGGFAGLLNGLLMAGFTLAVGSLAVVGVDMRKYLPALSPDNMKLFLLGRDPLGAALFYLALMVLMALLGAGLARGIGRSAWRRRLSQNLNRQKTAFTQTASVNAIRRSPLTRYLLLGLLAIVLLLLPLRLGQYWNYTVGTVGIYVLLGLGLNIVVGLAGLLDLGYVAFFAIGAYTVALLTAPEPHHLEWGFWAALLVGVLLAALSGVLLGVPVLRLRGDYLAIVTLGFGEIIRIMSRSDILTPLTAGPRGVRNIAGPTLFGRSFSSDVHYMYLIILAVLLIIFVTNRLQHSRVGRAWIAMREDEIVARAQGINTLVAKLLAFGIGAAFAGLGGGIFAARNQFTGPEDHTLMVSINVLSTVIVGGMGSIPGVIAGSFVLKGLPEILRELENFRILAFGGLLVVMMILRPEGIIPSQRRRLEMHQLTEEKVLEPDQTAPPGTPSTTEATPAMNSLNGKGGAES